MKHYSAGAKRKAKRSKGGVKAMQENWSSEATRGPVEIDKPQETVMQARARHTGKKATQDVLSPRMCEEAGQAIDAGAKTPHEADALWDTFKAYDAADETYSRRILGRPRFPAVSKLEFMPDRFEARADDRPDLRTEDEKIRDARNRMAEWDGHLARIPAPDRTVIRMVARHQLVLHERGKLTAAGANFVRAIRALHSEVEK